MNPIFCEAENRRIRVFFARAADDENYLEWITASHYDPAEERDESSIIYWLRRHERRIAAFYEERRRSEDHLVTPAAVALLSLFPVIVGVGGWIAALCLTLSLSESLGLIRHGGLVSLIVLAFAVTIACVVFNPLAGWTHRALFAAPPQSNAREELRKLGLKFDAD